MVFRVNMRLLFLRFGGVEEARGLGIANATTYVRCSRSSTNMASRSGLAATVDAALLFFTGDHKSC